MTLTHDVVTLNRTLNASVERAFAAWKDTQALEKWCCPGDNGWTGKVEEHQFEVGGTKRIVFGPEGDIPYIEDSRYLSIEPNAHIINSERVSKGGILISASKIVLEFMGQDNRCEIFVTDQITLLNDQDNVDDRRVGWGEVLDKLHLFVA